MQIILLRFAIVHTYIEEYERHKRPKSFLFQSCARGHFILYSARGVGIYTTYAESLSFGARIFFKSEMEKNAFVKFQCFINVCYLIYFMKVCRVDGV